jgi:hypothetical protein
VSRIASWLVAAAIAFAVLTPSVAAAQGVPSRTWGVGGGFAIGRERTSVNTDHTFVQPLNLELRIPVATRLELAAYVPLASIIYGNSLNNSGDQRFGWFDLFAVWYPLRESGGLFVAPGLGMIYGSTRDSSGVAIEIPARIGWETSSRGFGRAVSVRPWIDVVFPSGNVDIGTRYGLLFELTLIGYATQANK